MSDQAIIALVALVGSSLGTLIYYLMAGLKATLKESTGELSRKIESFVSELSKIKETAAVKATVIEYMQKELGAVKKHCWSCAAHDKKKE